MSVCFLCCSALQRILKVDYHIPSHIKLSPEGHDLLRRVLVADPAQRINVQQIYNHPWYCKNLPPGVKEMNDRPQPLPEGLQSVEEISRIVQVRGLWLNQCGTAWCMVMVPASAPLCRESVPLSSPPCQRSLCLVLLCVFVSILGALVFIPLSRCAVTQA